MTTPQLTILVAVGLNAALAQVAAATSDSPLTTTNILLILGAVTSSVVAIITVWHTGRKVDAVSVATDGQNVKLDRIEVLVDGRYGAVLQRLADVLVVMADRSGTATDRASAATAQNEADAQSARVLGAGLAPSSQLVKIQEQRKP
jgi:hypothetical protein